MFMQLLKGRAGSASVEYALVGALISIGIIMTTTYVGDRLRVKFEIIESSFANSGQTSGAGQQYRPAASRQDQGKHRGGSLSGGQSGTHGASADSAPPSNLGGERYTLPFERLSASTTSKVR